MKIYCLVSIYIQNTNIPYVRRTQNSNPSKKLYLDARIGQAKISFDSGYRKKCKQVRKINSHVQLFRTFSSIGFHGSVPSFIQRGRKVADVPILYKHWFHSDRFSL